MTKDENFFENDDIGSLFYVKDTKFVYVRYCDNGDDDGDFLISGAIFLLLGKLKIVNLSFMKILTQAGIRYIWVGSIDSRIERFERMIT